MHILLVSGPDISLKEPYNSGIESFMVMLANQLVKAGNTVDVIARDADPAVSFTVIDPFVKARPIRNPLLRVKAERRAFAAIDTDAYDVIHYNMLYPHLYEAGAAFHKPSILTLHSPIGTKRLRAYKKFDRIADVTFVAISERSKEVWESALHVETPLIHNGIDLTLWPVKPEHHDDYLLWSARITEDKNPLAAIKLAQHLGKPLKIAGKIVDKRYFATRVKPYLNDKIQYVGHLKQQRLSELAQNASAYLATATWQEPFGLAALEMLASGVPVVGFDTAVPPDWNTECASVVPSTKWQDLIAPLESSPAITPQMCRSFATTMSIRHMAENYTHLYDEILRKPAAANDAVQYGNLLDGAGQRILSSQNN